jgi:hypothetical protein
MLSKNMIRPLPHARTALPTPMACRRRDGEDEGSTTLWCKEEKVCTEGRRLALNIYIWRGQNRQIISRIITTLTWQSNTINARIIAHQNRLAQFSPCMQKYQVSKGSPAPKRSKARNHQTIHTHVMRPRPLPHLACPNPARQASARVSSPFYSPQWLQPSGNNSII